MIISVIYLQISHAKTSKALTFYNKIKINVYKIVKTNIFKMIINN